MEFSVVCKGFDELKAKLNTMAQDKAAKITARAVREGAKVFQAAVQQRAPVRTDTVSGTALPPGALASDVVIRRRKSRATGEKEVVVTFGKRTRHVARWVEYGHDVVRDTSLAVGAKGRGKGSLKKRGTVVTHVEAHPFIRPAFEEAIFPASEAVTDRLAADLANLDVAVPQELSGEDE